MDVTEKDECVSEEKMNKQWEAEGQLPPHSHTLFSSRLVCSGPDFIHFSPN